ncbi:hypothetical protein ISN45_Aa01g025900 [Arabidopsis thaliana x Arabidopsis arenosa]|uniref:Uncharacterized protein n=1 Tax=Arabidopsis thaliana x Arabidopsis arenosa TaxID=1240361 RepID=A0A8T2C6X0_9BRAS|nr:hypothetical protein ISN45_Aa01g025900 [Arabidopsis thaliana x Arabidopsis arenosa]
MEEQRGDEVFDLSAGIGVSITLCVIQLDQSYHVEAPYQNWMWHTFCRQELLHHCLMIISNHLHNFANRQFFGNTMLLHVTVDPISHLSSPHFFLVTVNVVFKTE